MVGLNQELTFNQEYTIAYVMGTDFEKRMYDMYIGCGTSYRPPYIEDIFTETSRLQSLLLLQSIKEQPDRLCLTEYEWGKLEQRIMEDDDEAKLDVLSRVSPHEVENVVHDILFYFNKNRLCTLRKTSKHSPVHKAEIIYSPTVRVW